MTRVKRGYVARNRRRSILKGTEGFRGPNAFRTKNQQNMKALKYAYRDRKNRKREFRRLWISRINASVRNHGSTYSKFMHLLKRTQIVLNRKVLSQIAILDRETWLRWVGAIVA